jgi:hypothetical protein
MCSISSYNYSCWFSLLPWIPNFVLVHCLSSPNTHQSLYIASDNANIIWYYYISYCKMFARYIYHILVNNITQILPYDKTLSLFRIIRGIMFISLGFTRMTQSGWKSKFINCFRDVITCLSVNTRKFTSWISRKLGGLFKLFYWIFAQNSINCQFSLLWYWNC